MSARVKICGLRELEHARAAVEAGADLLGFIFYPPVRRYVEPAAVKTILDALPRGRAEVVGVFVDESPDGIAEVADLLDLDYVQLSGGEPPALIAALGRPVVRTVHVDAATTLERVASITAGARLIHLDAKRHGQYGGTGERIDWAFARDAGALGPVLLAGGLNADNVLEAVGEASPWGVDVSSGVETDGVKDPAKIHAFVKAVKR